MNLVLIITQMMLYNLIRHLLNLYWLYNLIIVIFFFNNSTWVKNYEFKRVY